MPNPPPSFITEGTNNYVTPNFPGFTTANAQGVYTPEQLYPLTGVNTLTLNQSVSDGVDILDQAILKQIHEGNHVVVLTDSQSGIIASEAMSDLAALPTSEQPSADQLGFVFLVDPDNPNGGLFARYPDIYLPAFGLTLNGATPTDTIYPSDMYALEYDGASDYPQYPIDILADVNAVLGFIYVHPTAGALTPAEIATAIKLPTEGASAINYYVIPTEDLPLLDPLRSIPVIGNPLADLLQPDLTVLVNLGYGSPDFGYSTGPANVATPAGFLPNVDWATVLTDLITGAQRGVNAAISDIEAEGKGLTSLSDPVSSDPFAGIFTEISEALTPIYQEIEVSAPPVPVPTITPGDTVGNVISVVQALNTNTVENLTLALGGGAAAFLPPVDVASEVMTTTPSVMVNHFLSGIGALASGNVDGFVNDIGVLPGEFMTFMGFMTLFLGDNVLNLVATDVAALEGTIEGDFDIISALTTP